MKTAIENVAKKGAINALIINMSNFFNKIFLGFDCFGEVAKVAFSTTVKGVIS
jgi:hypothetical protein